MSETIARQDAKFAIFTIERTLKAPPKRVFAAWSTLEAKRNWFGAPAGEAVEEIREMDFREGGRERLRARWNSGRISDFRAAYWEIIPDRRIVYVYEMMMNDSFRMSVSLATIEFAPSEPGTRMKVTEQGAFLEPFDPAGDDAAGREHGTNWLMDKLVAFVDRN